MHISQNLSSVNDHKSCFLSTTMHKAATLQGAHHAMMVGVLGKWLLTCEQRVSCSFTNTRVR